MKALKTVGNMDIYSDGRIFHSVTGRLIKAVRKGDSSIRIPRFIAEECVPNPDNLLYVAHRGDPHDHSPSNLYWTNDKYATQRKYANAVYAVPPTKTIDRLYKKAKQAQKTYADLVNDIEAYLDQQKNKPMSFLD